MANSATAKPNVFKSLLHELTVDRTKPEQARMPVRDLANMLTMLSTLLDNGMPLQRALLALGNDSGLRKHKKILRRIYNRLVEGSSLHAALAMFPNAFAPNVTQQIKLGETSGNLPAALRRIAAQIESWLQLRQSLLQKLSYPTLVILAGSGLMTFMLTTVVPQFETIYSDSQVDLPWVTSIVTAISRAMTANLWLLIVPFIAFVFCWLQIRASKAAKHRFHRLLVKAPVIGVFVRDIAILQFLRNVHALSEAGFIPTDAIAQACPTVTNLYVREHLEKMANVLVHGTRLSKAMDDLDHLIPSAVRQLVMVGEHSGNITQSCNGACDFLQNRLQRRINGVMGMIEPILTIGLATCIGWVVLAMYMPMFKMFDVLEF